MSQGAMQALLVDPSLFTAPYDAELSRGLIAAGVEPSWAVRPTRPGDRDELEGLRVDPFFYRRVEGMTWLPARLRAWLKGISHLAGLFVLLAKVARDKPSVVHFQWLVLPQLDGAVMLLIRLFAPIVVTVHDTVPFNGEHLSFWQNWGFFLPLRFSERVIVHTQAGRQRLIALGIPEEKVAVVAHGPLPLTVPPRPRAEVPSVKPYTVVLFGELKHYKGFDILVEAVAKLPSELREQARFVVAGRPRMPVESIVERLGALGLERVFDLRFGRLSEQDMADLFEEADCFVFPYRQIDASGVYYLVKSFNKWLVASNVGIFAEDLREGAQGALVPPSDSSALAGALGHAISERPEPAAVATSSAWTAIGLSTRDLYEQARAAWRARAAKSSEGLATESAR